MEEELSLDNILGAEEIENLFVEDEDTQDTPPANGEPPKKEEEPDNDKEETTEVVDVDNLFTDTPESVGSGKENTEEKEDTTHANDLAYHILKLIQTEEYGVYHCTGKGECSWYDFASEIMKLSGRNCTVNPCTSSEYMAMYPNSADRPAYSSVDNMMLRCTIGDEMRDWKDALKTFMDNVEK